MDVLRRLDELELRIAALEHPARDLGDAVVVQNRVTPKWNHGKLEQGLKPARACFFFFCSGSILTIPRFLKLPLWMAAKFIEHSTWKLPELMDFSHFLELDHLRGKQKVWTFLSSSLEKQINHG